MKYANVIVDISLEKLDRTFQYRVPEALESSLEAGMQVRVPFGNGFGSKEAFSLFNHIPTPNAGLRGTGAFNL